MSFKVSYGLKMHRIVRKSIKLQEYVSCCKSMLQIRKYFFNFIVGFLIGIFNFPYPSFDFPCLKLNFSHQKLISLDGVLPTHPAVPYRPIRHGSATGREEIQKGWEEIEGGLRKMVYRLFDVEKATVMPT